MAGGKAICGCCRGEDKDPKRPLSEDETDRRCTDVLCLALFIAFFAGMLAIAGVAWSTGNYKRVVNGVDFRGCVCGTTSVLNTDGTCTEAAEGSANSFTLGGHSMFAIPLSNPTSPDFNGGSVVVCASACPEGGIPSGSNANVQLACTTDADTTILGNGSTYEEQLASLSGCDFYFATTAPTRSIAGYCVPKTKATGNVTAVQTAVDRVLGEGTWGTAVNSISTGWPVMLGACLSSLVIGFLYLYFVQMCAKILTFVAIITFQVILLAGGAFFILRANDIAATYDNDAEQYQADANWQMSFYGGIAIEVVAALYLCLMCFLWKRIFLAVALLEHAGKVLRDVWGVVFLPMLLVFLSLAVAAIWCVTTVLMFSLGTITTVDAPGLPSGVARTFSFDSTMRYALLYHLFGLFWATQFIQAITELTIAFVATHWFFSARVDGRKQLRPHTTLFAFNTVLRYHMGTAAFGSAVIAIIKTIRALIEYVQARIKKANRGSTLVQAVICLCRCCFWCLDCCMRFINRNAYAVVALTKQGFCASASTAFGYIARNLARVGALAGVSTAYLFLGKLFVAGVATAIGYVVFTQVSTYSDPASASAVASPFWPCMVIFLVSYNVGALFMSVYAVTIDAMLMCYVYNEDKHLIDDETGTAIDRLNKEAKAAGHGSTYEDDDVGETVVSSPPGPGGPAEVARPTYA